MLLAATIVTGLWLRPEDDDGWVVEARDPQVGLSVQDPCDSRPDVDDRFTTGGGSGYFALLGTASHEVAARVADCYEANGFATSVRLATSDDRTILDGGTLRCDGSDRLPCSYDAG